MKTLFAILGMVAALSLPPRASGQQPTQTKGSTAEAPRADATSNYVDWWMVRAGPTTLLSLFGYNSGGQQWVQIFDSNVGPTIAVTGYSATDETITNTTHGLKLGSRVQLTATFAGQSAGIYYAIPVDTARFKIATTLANAQAGTPINLTGSSATTTLNRLPIHTAAIASGDNFSTIVPDTGIGCGIGLSVANSTTAATYTAGAKDCTFTVTFRQSP